MLKKQLLDLEKPKDCIVIPINQTVEEICFMINSNLKKIGIDSNSHGVVGS